MAYKVKQSFSGIAGSFAPGELVQDDRLTPALIADYIRAGYLEKIGMPVEGFEQATNQAVEKSETAVSRKRRRG